METSPLTIPATVSLPTLETEERSFAAEVFAEPAGVRTERTEAFQDAFRLFGEGRRERALNGRAFRADGVRGRITDGAAERALEREIEPLRLGDGFNAQNPERNREVQIIQRGLSVVLGRDVPADGDLGDGTLGEINAWRALRNRPPLGDGEFVFDTEDWQLLLSDVTRRLVTGEGPAPVVAPDAAVEDVVAHEPVRAAPVAIPNPSLAAGLPAPVLAPAPFSLPSMRPIEEPLEEIDAAALEETADVVAPAETVVPPATLPAETVVGSEVLGAASDPDARIAALARVDALDPHARERYLTLVDQRVFNLLNIGAPAGLYEDGVRDRAVTEALASLQAGDSEAYSRMGVQVALDELGFPGRDGSPLAIDGDIGRNSRFALGNFREARGYSVGSDRVTARDVAELATALREHVLVGQVGTLDAADPHQAFSPFDYEGVHTLNGGRPIPLEDLIDLERRGVRISRHYTISDLRWGGPNNNTAINRAQAWYAHPRMLEMLDGATDRLQQDYPGEIFNVRSVWRDDSSRHRSGLAVDVMAPTFGGGLSLDERFQRVAQIFRDEGATSFGVYQRGPSTGMIHADLFRTHAVWGYTGSSATAPRWLRTMF